MLSKCSACGHDVELKNEPEGGLVQLDTEQVSRDDVDDNVVTKFVVEGDVAINVRRAERDAQIAEDERRAKADSFVPRTEDSPGPNRTVDGRLVEEEPVGVDEAERRYGHLKLPDTGEAYVEHRVLCPDMVTVTTMNTYPDHLAQLVMDRGKAHAEEMAAQ
jgi:hypothetical protein